jgi:hypothetical protein
MDPNTFEIESMPFSVNGNTLYLGLAIYSRELKINEMHLSISHYTVIEGPGSSWTGFPQFKINELSSRPLKRNATYIINISGTVDRDIKGLGVDLWQGNWEWIGGGGNNDVSKGTFNLTFEAFIFFDVDSRKETFLSVFTNNTRPPENLPQDTLMAIISNFKISFIEK